MSGGGGLRRLLAEAVARRIYAEGPDGEVDPTALVDELEPVVTAYVAALRAKADAADRVREGIEVLSRHRGLLVADDLWAALADLQRTLDGDSPC